MHLHPPILADRDDAPEDRSAIAKGQQIEVMLCREVFEIHEDHGAGVEVAAVHTLGLIVADTQLKPLALIASMLRQSDLGHLAPPRPPADPDGGACRKRILLERFSLPRRSLALEAGFLWRHQILSYGSLLSR